MEMATNQLYTLRTLLDKGVYDDETGQWLPVDLLYIPKLQRPYAQGRLSDNETEVRINFVKDLFDAITTGGQPIELNFVYGALIDNQFEILDGQQRLTTLFLLHWYVATRCGIDAATTAALKKFTYQTRTTSTQFISKLLTRSLTVTDSTLPGQLIKSQPWFTTSYAKDSTVNGMLNMLDEIHRHYCLISSDNRPTTDSLDNIRFYLLELKGFGLTDELFIKMNARGLALTPFENFKAELVGWVRENKYYEKQDKAFDQNMPLWLYFASQLDSRWVDLFWKMPTNDGHTPNPDDLGAEDADRNFFRFICRWLANRSLTLTDTSAYNELTDDFIAFNNLAQKATFHSFADTERFLNDTETKGVHLVRELSKTLDFFSNKLIKSQLIAAMTPPWGKAESTQMPWHAKFEMRPMIIFSAICEFIAKQSDDPAKFDSDEFNRWMRIVHNIVENRDINRQALQIVLTRQLKKAISHNTKPIYDRFLDYHQSLGGMSNREFTEEATKIKLINANTAWEQAFKEAEANEFLTGAVTSYLEDNPNLSTYRARTGNIGFIFNSKGVVEPMRANYALLRALLARYTNLSVIDQFRLHQFNISLSNENAADRFLKNFTIWNSNPRCRLLLCELLDCKSAEDAQQYAMKAAQKIDPVTVPANQADITPDRLQLITEGYKNLVAATPTNALRWIDSIHEKAMRVYFEEDGRMALYKGHINCMYVNTGRESYVDSLIENLYANAFKARFEDPRQLDAKRNYGFFSGTDLTIVVERHDIIGAISLSPGYRLQLFIQADNASDIAKEADTLIANNNYRESNGALKTEVADHRLLHCCVDIDDRTTIRATKLAEIVARIWPEKPVGHKEESQF